MGDSGTPAVVDLRSDTVTKPTEAMRDAMARAPVGDDMLEGDPTTRRLQERVASLLGKERALFFPTGIMANQTALSALSAPGTEIVLEADSHIAEYEEGAAAQLSGLQTRPVVGDDGVLTPDVVEAAIRPGTRWHLRTSVVTVENTHMASGGRVQPQEVVEEVSWTARMNGVAFHLDGARLWNAHVASGRSLEDLADPADTVMVSLSKGLGAPMGSILAGPAMVLEEAWRIRRRFGGGMHQNGILAAAGIHALDHHLERLEEDHQNARLLAEGLDAVDGLSVIPPETNAVLVDLERSAVSGEEGEGRGTDAPRGGAAGRSQGGEAVDALLEALEREGIRMIPFGPGRIRAVTHLGVDREGIERTVEVVERVLEESRT